MKITKPSSNNKSESLCVLGFDLTLTETAARSVKLKTRLSHGEFIKQLHGPLMSEQTNRARDCANNPVVVWALHFPPTSDGELLGFEACAELAGDLKVPLIFAGHIHKHTGPHKLANGVEVWIGNTACQFGHKGEHSFHVAEIDVCNGQFRGALMHRFVYRHLAFQHDGYSAFQHGHKDRLLVKDWPPRVERKVLLSISLHQGSADVAEPIDTDRR